MRLQKFLAQAGYGARRKCEQMIAAGRVSVNGQIAQIGASVSPGDDVRVDGRRVAQAEAKVYIALHKPTGYSSDLSDPRNKSMFELVRVPQRLFGVGRLDKDSSGLILLTNDGEFAYQLTHPSFEHEKEYRVLVAGRPGNEALKPWREGMLLEGETTRTAPCRVEIIGKTPTPWPLRGPLTLHRDTGERVWLRVVMHEGRKRQIRRIAKAVGHPVLALQRVRVGSVRLGALKSGEWRRLSEQEVRTLMSASSAGR